jgi:hypothetical protein
MSRLRNQISSILLKSSRLPTMWQWHGTHDDLVKYLQVACKTLWEPKVTEFLKHSLVDIRGPLEEYFNRAIESVGFSLIYNLASFS